MAFSIENQVNASGTGFYLFTLGGFAITSANKLVVVVCDGSDNSTERTPANVTYAGDALTVCAESDDTIWEYSSIWFRDAPDVGTADIVVDWDPYVMQQVGVAVTGLIGAAMGAPVSVQQALVDTVANPSLTLTGTQSGDICIGAYASDLGPDGTTTANGHSFMDQEDVETDSDFSAQDVTSSGTSTVVSWTAISPSVGNWAICGAAFRALATGTWQTTLGLPIASILARLGLARASIKTMLGLTP